MFQQGVVDPAMRQYENQILPSIQQRFVDANAGSSSALNQALSQSAGDLSSVLAGKRIDLQGSMANQQLGGLNQILGLLGQRSFDPIVQGPQAGMLKDLIAGGSQVGAAAAFAGSSRDIKENIENYSSGLEITRSLNVKQYDYKIPVVGKQVGRIGLIAEEVPEDLTADIDGVKSVDLYGLISILINSIKELDSKTNALEEKCQSLLKA